MGPASMRPRREAPFAGIMLEEGDLEAEEEVKAGPSHADVFSASSSSDSSSEVDSTTELGVRPPPAGQGGSRAIPIGSSRRSLSDSVPSGSGAASGPSARFSPLQSRPVGGQPITESPASTWNRSRRGASGFGTGSRRRGRGRGGSASPGPASVEERRRARAAAATAAGLAYATGSEWAGSGVRYSEGEGSSAERGEHDSATQATARRGRAPSVALHSRESLTSISLPTDEAFQDLLSTARFFSDLSPRASRAPFSSLPSSYDSGRTTLPPASSSTSAWAASAVPSSSAGPRSRSSSDEGAAEESDPALASESVPTLESLSSGAEGESSPLLGLEASEVSKRTKETRQDQQRSESHSSERAADPAANKEKKPKKKGWFSWFRGGTIELKVWHLVGICGVLIGAGWAAGYATVSLGWVSSKQR